MFGQGEWVVLRNLPEYWVRMSYEGRLARIEQPVRNDMRLRVWGEGDPVGYAASHKITVRGEPFPIRVPAVCCFRPDRPVDRRGNYIQDAPVIVAPTVYFRPAPGASFEEIQPTWPYHDATNA